MKFIEPMHQMNAEKLPAIQTLTSLRFFAALMVFFSHLCETLSYKFQSPLANFIWYQFLHEGYIGVTFFFILSGFILTYNYNSALNTGGITRKRFFALRFARIYPTHFLTFFLALALAIIAGKPIFSAALSNLTLVQSFISNPSYYFSYNAVSWSISDEMFFYLCLPFLIRLNYKILLPIACVAGLLIASSIFLHAGESKSHWIYYINPCTRILDFILGIGLGKLFLNRHFNGHRMMFGCLELISVTALLLAIYMALRFNVHQTYRYDVFYMLPMAAIIFIFAWGRGIFSRLLSHKILVFLGEASFAIYMFHQLIMSYTVKFFAGWDSLIIQFTSLSEFIEMGVFIFFLTIIISSLSFIYFEKPLNKYLRYLFKQRLLFRRVSLAN